jgi:Gpi18-like mannosyltransferase
VDARLKAERTSAGQSDAGPGPGASARTRDPSSGGRGRSLRLLLWRLDTPLGLAGMFGLAFLIRALIAPHVGFYGDLRLFQMWATRLDEVGPHRFYVEGQFADYPPGYLYVLWLLGKISSPPGYLLLKLPAILADLGLAWIAGTFAARMAPASVKERLPVRALAAAAVLFNPAVIALSAVWGQVDVVPAMFVLGSLLLLFTGPQSLRREIAAFLLFAVAVAMKPQAGFVLPVMLYALYRRYLRHRPRQELVDGWLAIAMTGVLSLGLWAVSGLAFGLGPVSLIRFYRHSASVYPVTSANAFNLWGALGFWRNDSSGDHVMTIAGISALHFGTLLFVAGVVAVLWSAHRAIQRGADETRVLTVAAAASGLLAYTLLTRMHERYMFVSLACLAPLVLVRPLRLAYAGLSALFILNLWYPYAYFNSQWKVEDFHKQPWFDWIFGSFANDTWQKKVWSLAVTAFAIALVWRGVRWAAHRQPEPGRPEGRLRLHSGLRDRFRALRDIAPSVQTAAMQPAGKGSRWWPLMLVTLACVFGLVVLRGETTAAPNLNDSAFHLQMVRWADGQIGEGRVPLDGWYPYLSLGSSQFHHYQSLPHTLTAYTARVTGAGDESTYLWIQYLLLALWPIAVYLAARLLGWGRWTAAAAAAVSPLIVSASGYGYEHASYTWRGYGVYSQLWAMWLLPIAWGLTWRAVARGRYYAAAAAALALTIACHFITGYLALLTVGVWVIALGRWGVLRRAGRAALVTGGSLLVASWVLVPLIGDTRWTNQGEYYKGSIFNDSYGARKVLGWLFTGDLFDHGRFPIVTILFFAGVLVLLVRARRDVRARVLLGAFTLSLLLFFGRPTLGWALDLLPGFGDVQIHRFVVGVDLAGILIAGVGLGWLVGTASRVAGRLATGWLPPGRLAVVAGAVALLLCVGVLEPAWADRARYDRQGAQSIRTQRISDATDGRDLDSLVAIVKKLGDGRVYAGLRGNWGAHYAVGAVPVHAWLADRDVDAIGFAFRTIASLSTDVEAAFDETNPAQYEMFNVRYLILPSDREPTVPATLLTSSGRHRLYEVHTTGYLQVVDRAPAVAANRTNLQQATLAFRRSGLASQAIYPGVAFAGGQAPPPTFTGASPPEASPGRVLGQAATIQDGVFTGTIEANRPAVVLLKATYDRRWTATVDGLPEKPAMMAPSLAGVEVPAGRHVVEFEYRPYDRYPLLVGIGAITLLGLVIYPRRAALRLPRSLRGNREPGDALRRRLSGRVKPLR